MSYPPPGDQNQPPQQPAGQPPQYPAGQPPQYPTNQPPQQPYGGGTSGGGYVYPPAPPTPGGDYGYGGGYEAHMERPGTVTAGSVIAIILSALSALTAAALIVAAIVAWDDLLDELRSDPEQYELDASQLNDLADAQGAIIGVIVIWLLLAAFGVFLGIMTMKGQNWARITMTVFAALTLISALIMITSLISALWLLGSIACIILVYVGGANDWFRYQRELRRQP